jgi:hypothetical protein
MALLFFSSVDSCEKEDSLADGGEKIRDLERECCELEKPPALVSSKSSSGEPQTPRFLMESELRVAGEDPETSAKSMNSLAKGTLEGMGGNLSATGGGGAAQEEEAPSSS